MRNFLYIYIKTHTYALSVANKLVTSCCHHTDTDTSANQAQTKDNGALSESDRLEYTVT